jgi:murein DD-endopeptidase MepM/ murein hydrolase activator NlpD
VAKVPRRVRTEETGVDFLERKGEIEDHVQPGTMTTRPLLLFFLLLCMTLSVQAQTFRLRRPVPDNIQTNGSYLYGEPRLNNPGLAHTAIDISISYDTVRSASDGTVWFVGYDPGNPTGGYEPTGCGNYLFVQSPSGSVYLYLLYCHLSVPLVTNGQTVVRGTPIAVSGNTGNSTGPHLHFELRLGTPSSAGSKTRRNPELWVAISGMGAIYGRVPNAPNSTRVDISPDPKPRPPYSTFSYALTYNFGDPAIGSDDVYGENYAIGDVKPGTYTITALGGGYQRVVRVGAGEVVNADAGVSFVAEAATVPEDIFLAQNFPNPFNPRTTIRVDLPEAHRLAVKVYDVIGREVALLADGIYEPGVLNLQFEGSGSPSGVLFCRMIATRLSDGRVTVAVRRMVLQR